MDVGEGAGVAIPSGLDESLECPMTHKKPVEIASQPAKKVKDVEKLKSNMKNGMSTRLFDVDNDGNITDKGLQKLETEDPSPADAIIAANGPNPVTWGFSSDPNDPPPAYPLSMAAHHIIPGEDSLPKSPLAKYVWKSEGTIFTDIGFHVDGSENGVWLPTHQALSTGLGKAKSIALADGSTKSYAQLSDETSEDSPVMSFIEAYTQAAMKLTRAQFHDSHKEYSENVVKELQKISVWLDAVAGPKCDQCNTFKQANDKFPSPHWLVYRLNGLTRVLKTWLLGQPNSWRAGFFTSDYARLYKKNHEEFERQMANRR